MSVYYLGWRSANCRIQLWFKAWAAALKSVRQSQPCQYPHSYANLAQSRFWTNTPFICWQSLLWPQPYCQENHNAFTYSGGIWKIHLACRKKEKKNLNTKISQQYWLQWYPWRPIIYFTACSPPSLPMTWIPCCKGKCVRCWQCHDQLQLCLACFHQHQMWACI